ncbi:MAG: hypothetical protein H7329_18150, partial [Opitutaceae bacterium]|nr:hypothetical protein [Cytophagales bacterium]
MKRKLLIIAILSVSVLKIFGQTKIFVPGGTTNGIVSNTNATTNPNDYVGIGISSFTPSEMLHVNGGNLQINNSISQVRGSIVSNFLVSDKILAEFTSDYSNIKDVFQYRSNKLFLHRTDLATSIATESMYMGSIPISGNPMGLVSYSGNLALWAEGARNVSFYTNKRERFTV